MPTGSVHPDFLDPRGPRRQVHVAGVASPQSLAPVFLFPGPYSLLNVIEITVSTNSPLYFVQSNETNQLGRFFFACESVFFTKSGAYSRA
jgi:hypothetical protein